MRLLFVLGLVAIGVVTCEAGERAKVRCMDRGYVYTEVFNGGVVVDAHCTKQWPRHIVFK